MPYALRNQQKPIRKARAILIPLLWSFDDHQVVLSFSVFAASMIQSSR